MHIVCILMYLLRILHHIVSLCCGFLVYAHAMREYNIFEAYYCHIMNIFYTYFGDAQNTRVFLGISCSREAYSEEEYVFSIIRLYFAIFWTYFRHILRASKICSKYSQNMQKMQWGRLSPAPDAVCALWILAVTHAKVSDSETGVEFYSRGEVLNFRVIVIN